MTYFDQPPTGTPSFVVLGRRSRKAITVSNTLETGTLVPSVSSHSRKPGIRLMVAKTPDIGIARAASAPSALEDDVSMKESTL